MKKIFRIFIAIFFILNISIVYVNSETFSLIEEKLENIGVSEKYSDNIINYITNLKLSKEEAKKILDKANDFISIDDAKRYYKNYTKLPFTYQDYEKLKSYISENTIINKENIKNGEGNNTETLNSVSAIKRKNVNRVLSIIFLVVFTCVVISLLIDSIFFNKEKK